MIKSNDTIETVEIKQYDVQAISIHGSAVLRTKVWGESANWAKEVAANYWGIIP